MSDGAYEYLTRRVEPRRLPAFLDNAVEKTEAGPEVTVLRRHKEIASETRCRAVSD
jgi:hypothetical protein